MRWPKSSHDTDHCSSRAGFHLIECVGESGIEAGAGISKGLTLMRLCTQSFCSVLLPMQWRKIIDGCCTLLSGYRYGSK